MNMLGWIRTSCNNTSYYSALSVGGCFFSESIYSYCDEAGGGGGGRSSVTSLSFRRHVITLLRTGLGTNLCISLRSVSLGDELDDKGAAG